MEHNPKKSNFSSDDELWARIKAVLLKPAASTPSPDFVRHVMAGLDEKPRSYFDVLLRPWFSLPRLIPVGVAVVVLGIAVFLKHQPPVLQGKTSAPENFDDASMVAINDLSGGEFFQYEQSTDGYNTNLERVFL